MKNSNDPLKTGVKYSEVDELVDVIFERQYYTNHGPELQKLENELELLYPDHNVLGLANFDIAFLISLVALGTENKVLLPSIIEQSTYQSLVFLKRELEIISVNSYSGIIDLNKELILGKESKDAGVLVVNNTFGNTPNIEEFYAFAKENNVSVILLSKDGFGLPDEYHWPNDVLLIEIFDFSERSFINAGTGSVVKCNHNKLAEKIRNIRSSYGSREKMSIPFTGNGRMSELQAGLIRKELKKFLSNTGIQYKTYNILSTTIENIPGIQVIKTDKLTTRPFFDKLIIKTSGTLNIDTVVLNEKLRFFNVDFKSPKEYELITLKNQETEAFFKSTFILSLPATLTMEETNEVKCLLEEQL